MFLCYFLFCHQFYWVLGLSSNLLFLSSFTKELNCSSQFFQLIVISEDLQKKKLIGGGHAENGLYDSVLSRKKILVLVFMLTRKK